ncbi:MAG: hypothetical protein GY725_04655 [bacterium]|nr:hypothetical protein [bacterium]
MTLRIALFGQAQFGLDCLSGLLEAGHEVVGVFAPPEAGRPDPLAERASELGIPLVRRRYYRKKTGAAIPAALEAYRELDAQLNVLASVQVFLPPEIVDAPVHKSLCFHPSLLPKYRGGAAMQWQIIEGVEETGVSIFVPDQGADTGPIVVQHGGIALDPNETTGTLFFKKLHPAGVAATLEAVRRVDSGTAEPQKQDEGQASEQPMVDDEVAAIDLKRPAIEIDRLVRACDPQPGAFLRQKAEIVRLFDVSLIAEEAGSPGSLVSVSESGMRIALVGGTLCVGRVRADGKKEAAQEWIARVGLKPGDRFESGA